MSAPGARERTRALADLLVRFGANVQPGQIVAISAEPGKEELVRAIAEVAYEQSALFVDVSVFDLHVKRARALYASPDTLGYVPSWYGERVRALGEERAAIISLTGPADPTVMEGVHPELLGKDMLPRVKESVEIVNARLTNWTVGPCPTPGWAKLVHPQLGDRALGHLWDEIAHVCRLDEEDVVAAWEQRLAKLTAVARRLDDFALDELHLQGPGTDLRVGLLRSSMWQCAHLSTVEGIVHVPNLPTEEVFTTPDPERVEGVVTATKPLFTSGALITGLRVRFEGGRAVEIDADEGAGALRALSDRDPGAARLGEVALVDREGRIGKLGTIFYDTLLDENAASHIALGQGLEFGVEGEDDLERINHSALHVDFMVGSADVAVTGITGDGAEVPLLRDGAWQV